MGHEVVERVLARRNLSPREQALCTIVDASANRDENTRKQLIEQSSRTLTYDEVYQATIVVALFEFYNTFVDLNGVAPLTAEGYEASGVRLSTLGYSPPTAKPNP